MRVISLIGSMSELRCKLFAEQVRKGNRPNTHLNQLGFTEVSNSIFQCTEVMLSKKQLKNKWDKPRLDTNAWKKLLRKQTGVSWKWSKGTINMETEWWKKFTKEIPSVEKFKRRPLQNEDDMKVMFGDITNDEQDHWNPMSSNPIIPVDDDLLHDDN